MDEQDAFFTQAVVGAPFSVLLGRRMSAPAARAQGLALEPATGESRLDDAWRPWVMERLAELPPGVPRARPKGFRRWLERHALGVAVLGLISLAGGLVLMAQAQGWLEPWLKALPW